MTFRSICCIAFSLLAFGGAWAGGTPQGTAFTYQGVLKQGGAPMNGICDLTFRLFDDPTAGSVLGTITLPAQAVTGGLVTSSLDFGSLAFTGEARWLEIQVDATILSPRQSVAATPYALYALNAAYLPLTNFPTGGAWSLSSGLDLDSGTLHVDPSNNRVGIGTSAPAQTLHVVGNSDVTAQFENSSTSATTLVLRNGSSNVTWQYGITGSASPPGQAGTMYFQKDGHSEPSFMINANGCVGIGGEGGGSRLKVLESGSLPGIFVYKSGGGGTTGTGILVGTDSVDGTGVWAEAHSDSGSGSGVEGRADAPLGAGVTGRATGSGSGTGVRGFTSSGRAVYGRATGSSGLNYGVYGDTASAAGYAGYFVGGRNYFQGSVGIGTTDPGAPLDVTGIIRSSGSGGALEALNPNNQAASVHLSWLNDVARIRIGGGGAGSANGLDIQRTTDVSLMRILHNGSVGIGTTAPAFLLHVNGTAGKPGGGSWSATSDVRLKKNIFDLTGALDSLLSLHGVRFEYIDPSAVNEPPGQRIGMIAQEVERVFPEWVCEAADGYKRVAYSGFEALTVEALRDLREEKDSEIDALRAENNSLRDRLDAVERLVHELVKPGNGDRR